MRRKISNYIKKALLKILYHTKNPKVKQSIISIFGRKIKDFESLKCEIKIISYDVFIFYKKFKLNPGNMCFYEGGHTPVSFQNED